MLTTAGDINTQKESTDPARQQWISASVNMKAKQRGFDEGKKIVPVSTARSMGANFVIAVDVNHGIVEGKIPEIQTEENALTQALNRIGGKQYSQAMERINLGLQSLDNPAQIRSDHGWQKNPCLTYLKFCFLQSISWRRKLLNHV